MAGDFFVLAGLSRIIARGLDIGEDFCGRVLGFVFHCFAG